MQQQKLHYKMYKNGKHWVFAGVLTVTLGIGVLGVTTTASAADDNSLPTETAKTVSPTQTSESTLNNVVVPPTSATAQAPASGVTAQPMESTASRAASTSKTSIQTTSENISSNNQAQAASATSSAPVQTPTSSAASSNATQKSASNVSNDPAQAAITAASEVTNQVASNTSSQVTAQTPASATQQTTVAPATSKTSVPVPTSTASTQPASTTELTAKTGTTAKVATLNNANQVPDVAATLTTDLNTDANAISGVLRGLTQVTKDNFLEYFNLNGSATYDQEKGVVTLTPDKNNLVGNFSLIHKIDMKSSFTLTGAVNIGNKTSQKGGADGIGFAFHNGNTTDIGNAGGNLGIGGLLNAIGFKLDTWHNVMSKPQATVPGVQVAPTDSNGFGWAQDPTDPQFGAIVTTSDQQVEANDGQTYQRWWATTDLASVKAIKATELNGEFSPFVVRYNGSTRTLKIEYTEASGNVLAWTTAVPDAYQAMAMIVSASTGSSKNLHQFKITSFDFQEAATVNVKYVDTQGQQLAQGEVTYPNGANVNGTYETEQLKIENYQFLKMDDGSVTGTISLPASGILNQAGDNGTVIYVYAPAYQITATKTVNETIHYVDQEGTSVTDRYQANPIHFVTVKNPLTNDVVTYYSSTTAEVSLDEHGIPEGTAWTQGASTEFISVKNPEVSGYRVISNNAPNSDLTQVVAQPVNSTSGDLIYTVVYAPTYQVTATKTVNETIHYVDQQGKAVADHYQATPIHFVTVHNPVTNTDVTYYSTTAAEVNLDEHGVPTGTDWTQGNSADFASILNPVVTGYKVISNDAPSSDLNQVAAQTVNSTSADLVYTVVYAPAYQITATKTVNETIHYVDQQGKAVADHYQATPIHFVTVHNPVTNTDVTYYSTTAAEVNLDEHGVPTGTDWTQGNSADFASILNPVVTGYKVISNDAPNSDLNQVVAQTINSTSADLVYTVVYAPAYQITATKTVNETIHYVDQQGATVATSYQATPINFITVHDQVTNTDITYYSTTAAEANLDEHGIPEGTAWTQGASTEFISVVNPVVTGYKVISNNAPNSDLNQVVAQTVNSTSADLIYTVVYAPAYQVTATKTVNETIHYVDQQGKAVADHYQATPIHFVTVHNPVTNTDITYYSTTAAEANLDEHGVPTGTDWTQGTSADFASILNPVVTGYKVISNDAPNSDLAAVAAQTVNSTSTDLIYTVVYAPAYQVTATKTVNETIHYVDQQGKAVANRYQATPINFVTVHNPVTNTDVTYYSTTAAEANLDEHGVPTGTAWTQGTSTEFMSVVNPVVAGYKVISNDAPNSDLNQVVAQTINSTSADLVYTVVYAPTYQVTATKTVNETIHYVDQQGKTVATSYQATPIHFVTVHNPVTGVDTVYYSTTTTESNLDENGIPEGTAWTQGASTEFISVVNPVVTGYKVISNNAPNSDLNQVVAQTVTSTSADLIYTVVYAPAYQVTATKTVNETIHYVDQQGATVVDRYQATPINFITVHNPVTNTDVTYYSTTAAEANLDEHGVPEGTAWTQGNSTEFISVVNPAVTGYKVISNDAPDSDLATVAAQTVNSTSADLVYTVVYAPAYQVTATKTVNETIHYVDQQGKAVATSYQATPIHFVTVHNPVTGVDTVYYSTTAAEASLDENGLPEGTAWTVGASTAFASVQHPAVSGYQVIRHNAPESDLNQVSAQMVTNTSDDLVYIVVYAPDLPTNPEEPENPDVPEVPEEPGNPDIPGLPEQPQQPNGPDVEPGNTHHVNNPELPTHANITYPTEMLFATQAMQQVNPTQTSTKVVTTLPQTGAKRSTTSLASFGVLSIIGALLGFIGIRKKDQA